MKMGSGTGHGGTANVRPVQSAVASADWAGADTTNILDAVDVPIVTVSRDCTVSRFNRAAADALGLVPSDIGRLPCDIPALANVKDLEELCAQVIADQAPCRRDIQDGERCFILGLAPHAGSTGQVESVVLTFSDVTPARTGVEQAIDEPEYTKAVLDIVIEPLVVLDSDLRVQTANRAFSSMFGVSRRHLGGVPLSSLGDKDWKTSSLWLSLQAILSDGGEFRPFETERDFPTLGRRTILIDARRVARDGDPTILVAFQDITDRKRAEENLRGGEQELRDFLENAGVGMHWVGADGIIVWANRTELELLGYTREEYVGHHIAEFHADAAVVENILRQLTNGEAVHEYETRLRCKDGSTRDVLINSNVLREGDRGIHIRCFTRDITERKQAEQTRARLAAIVESSDDAIVSKDLNGVITSWNRGAERIFGYTAEEAIGRPVAMLIPPDRLDEEPHILERIRRGERIDHYETVRRRKDGTLLHISLTVSPIADAHGRIVGASKTARDITARKRADQALSESERRFREIIDALPAAVYTTDALGRLTHFNQAAVEFSGRNPELGTDQWCVTWKLYRPDGTPLPHDECPMAIALKEGRAVRGEQVIAERPDGKRLWCEPYPTPLFDSEGRLTGGINMLLDITERKQAEEELRRRTKELTAFFENATTGLHWVGPDGIIQWVNQAELEMLGYTREEYEGHHIGEFHADPKVIEDILARLARNEKLKNYEVQLRCKDGSIRDVLIDSTVLWDQGRFVHTQCFSRDITERKRMEEELQRLNTDLEKRVRERTAELLSTIEQREKLHVQLLQAQKMESIGTLAGGIAHDFNNLLNIILAYTMLIQHKTRQNDVSEASDVIKDTVQRAAALVQQLLSIARKTEISFEEININTVLEKLRSVLSEAFPKTIDIAADLNPEIPSLILDPNQIHQVLLNLCVNAKDAMPGGGKLLLASSIVGGAEVRRRFVEAKHDLYVRVAVTDTGTGIDDAHKNHVFEPFFTTKRHGEGTGLGLSVAYGIVANHSGFIDFESEPGRGTTFSIYLPITKDRPEIFKQEQQLDGQEEIAGCGETVLFVDDEENQLRLMRRFLEDKGYRVLVARDGAEAVDLHRRHKDEIAAAVLDLGLPKLNGWEAFQKMKKIDPNLTAVFATGFLPPELQAEITNAQPGSVISKPYQPVEILKKLSAASRKRPVGEKSGPAPHFTAPRSGPE